MSHHHIAPEEVPAARVAFERDHATCAPEDVELHEGSESLVCICNRCRALETYEVEAIRARVR